MQLAAAGREGARTGLPEEVRAETFLAQLAYDRAALEELLFVEEERLRSLCALPPETPLGRPRGLSLPAFELQLAPLREAAVQHNQELMLAALHVDAARAQQRAAELRSRPDLELGARFIATDALAGSADPDNGEDPLLIELGLRLPVWGAANRAAASEARSNLRAARHRRDLRLETLRADLAQAWWEAAAAERLARLYRGSLLPQAERAARAAEGLYEAGETGFAGLLETAAAWQHFQLAALRAEADYGRALARLEQLVGLPLAALPGPPGGQP